MKIFLIGFMGCGKSTLGKRLAKKLKYPFIDLDKQFEELTGTTIAAYFDQYGEAIFRETERSQLQNAAFPEDIVIATGGGLPCFFDNMDWMNANGTTVYINLNPAALAGRLMKGKDERPLIRDLDDGELVDFITAKLEGRAPFYNRAKYILDGIDLTPEKVIGYLF